MFTPSQMVLDNVEREFGLPVATEIDQRKLVWLAFHDLAEFVVHHTPSSQGQRKALRLLLHARSAAMESLTTETPQGV